MIILLNYQKNKEQEYQKLAVDLLTDMIKIYSPSGKESTLADYLARRMKNDLDIQNVNIDKANNVIGEIGTGNPVILLCGHMDTIPDKQEIEISETAICGRGACDAKSALAAQIMAAHSLIKSEFDGKIIIAAVTDEEGNGAGINELMKHNLKIDYAIFGEPSGIDSVTIGYKGRISLSISCTTPSAHASAPWLSKNSIDKVFEVWKAIEKYAYSNISDKSHYNSVTACITRINGGTADNVMPGKCEIVIDIRVPLRMGNQTVMNDLKEIIGRFQNDSAFPQILTKILDNTEPFEAKRDSPLIKAAIKSGLEIRKKRPLLLLKTGTGDMNILANTLKIPVITYGPGNPHMSHTSKERIEISDYLESIEVYKRTILNIIKFHRK